MTYVEKEGVVMGCHDVNHLAAFLNNGWKVVEKEAPKSAEPAKRAGRPKKEQ